LTEPTHENTGLDGVNSFTEVRVYYMLPVQTLISSSKAVRLMVCDLLMLTVPDYLPVLHAHGIRGSVVVVEDMESSSDGTGFSQMIQQNVLPLSANA